MRKTHPRWVGFMFYQLNNTRAFRLKAGLEPATIYNILNFSESAKGMMLICTPGFPLS